MPVYAIFLLYWLAVSLVTVIVTIADKRRAVRHRYRISEAALLWLAVFGGSIAEWLTMLIIRHKTRHPKFMIGLPVIIVLQLLSATLIIYFYGGLTL